MISSTATTVSQARQTRVLDMSPSTAAVVIVVASAVVNLRILIEIGIIGPGLLPQALPPFLLLGVFMGACSVYLLRQQRGDDRATQMQHRNPAQISTALTFGAFFALVIVLVAAVKSRFGLEGVYVVALVSGLTDVDAMTLSVADLYESGRLGAADAWRVILVASLANLLFKAGVTAVFGTRQVFTRVAVVFGLTALLGVGLLYLWPVEGLPMTR